MTQRAAIVTGASRGIGLAIAEVLGEEGYALTLAARRPNQLAATAGALTAKGLTVQHVAADMRDEDAIKGVVAAHADRYGRLDVLVNSAGLGVGAAAGEHQTKFLDMQLDVNVRAIILFYRECLDLLKAAGAEHGQALVVNMSSIAGLRGQAWLSAYAATKFAVRGYTASMNEELGGDGIKSVALCPGFVDTDMTDFAKGEVAAEEMIRPADIAEAVRFLLRLSPACVVPEIAFQRPGGSF